MAWLDTATDPIVLDRYTTTDYEYRGYTLNGVFYQTSYRSRSKVVIQNEYRALTYAAACEAESTLNADANNSNVKVNRRDDSGQYGVTWTNLTAGAWTAWT